MSANSSFCNYGPGYQNTIAGGGPQFNLNGTGTQNNYYAPFQDLRTNEEEKLRGEKEDCLRSLGFPNMNTRRQNIDDALPGTCDWLFSTTEFEQWRNRINLLSHNGVLWIKGKPGTGKSTLMNRILSYCEEILSNHLIVAYFFNARGEVLEKTPLGMMRSIVYQLLKKEDTLHETFLDYYREKRMICSGEKLQWEQSELKKFIQSIGKKPQLQSKPLLFLVDALDECHEKDVRGVIDFFQTLSGSAVNAGIELRICLSSRHYPRVSMRKNLELIVEGRQEHRADIATYVKEKLYTDNHSIQHQIWEKADGIFMWVVLVVAMLNKAYDEGRDEAVHEILNDVPEDLEGIFHTLLETRDDDKSKAELVIMLQWVLFSQRPLSPEELFVAAVNESVPSHEAIRRRIISSSKGLIEVRKRKSRANHPDTEFVQFIHLSVNDFLCRTKRLETLDPTLEPDATSASHARLWAFCREYLSATPLTSKMDVRLRILSRPFVGYAVNHILSHADKALSNVTIGCRLYYDIAQWLGTQDDWIGWLRLTSENETQNLDGFSNWGLVYMLADGSHRNLIQLAIDNGAGVNAQGGYYGNALQAACAKGNYDIVKLLLENGADINTQGGLYSNILQATFARGNYDIMKLLLENGADVNAQGGYYSNVLQAACAKGNYDIVKLLLENGADINIEGGFYSNVLQAACAQGNYDIMNLLLENGADVNAQGGYHGNALRAACARNKYDMVKLLLEKGADVNAYGWYYGNAFPAAYA